MEIIAIKKDSNPFSTAEDANPANAALPLLGRLMFNASVNAREKEQGLGKNMWLKSLTPRAAGHSDHQSCLSVRKPILNWRALC